MPSIVSCLCWVEKGKARAVPEKVALDRDEIGTLIQGKRDDDEGSSEEGEEAMEQIGGNRSKVDKEEEEEEDVDQLYQLDKYESDEESIGGEKATIGGLSGLTYYASNEEDPYITLKVMDDDEEDFLIQDNDNLLLIGKAEDEYSSIEVHVFNERDNHLYCHHEIMVNAYPLTLEWLNYDPAQPEEEGNFVAIGSMCPAIEIWDLDVVDAVEPLAILGTSVETMADMMKLAKCKSSKKKNKKKKKKQMNIESTDDEPMEADDREAAAMVSKELDSHLDAVMGLAWNRTVRSLLASASADNTVRIWDLSEGKTLLTLNHPDKVQTIQWHPKELSLLASGCYDGIVRLFNCEDGSLVMHWKLNGEIEKLLWNHFQPDQLLVSTEKSQIYCLERKTGQLAFTIDAHTEAITDISLSCQVPGLLVTSSSDDTIKFWDIHEKSPVFLYTRPMHMGAVLCSSFCKDNPYILSVGGQTNSFQVINVLTQPPLYKKCKERGLSLPESVTDPTGAEQEPEDDVEEEQKGSKSMYSDPKAKPAKFKGKSVVRKKDKVKKRKQKT